MRVPNRAMQEDLRTEAAEWVATLHDKVPSSEAEARAHEDNCTQFVEWLRRSPDHVAAFLRADDTFCRLAGMDPSRRINVEVLQERYSNQIDNAERSFATASVRQPPRIRRKRLFAWAASVLIVVAGAWVWETNQREGNYATAVGEQRNVKLPDGSVMTLNTDSEAKVEFSAGQRRIYLMTGEALFEVEHDEQRPFVVVTPSARVRAVGTRFDVYQHERTASSGDVATTVSVLEGVVQVAPAHSNAAEFEPPAVDAAGKPAIEPSETPPGHSLARLAAGEQANISTVGVTKKAAPDLSDAVAWRERILVFRGTPLADVAAEYNRYNTRKIRIDDPEIAQRPMSGTYSADHPQLLVAYLEKDNSISVTITSSGWVVEKR
jgi:transmembrane sensor